MTSSAGDIAARLSRLGRLKGAAVVLVSGYALTALIGFVLGLGAVAIQQSFDAPLYDWLVRNYSEGSAFTALSKSYTGLGDVLPSVWLTLAATVVLAVIFGRRWWIPVTLLPLSFVLEYGLQIALANVINRGHPYLGTGTYFSGGSARFVIIFGLILFLIVLRWPQISRAWRIVGVALVALLALAMGLTRLYLLHHWPTDVPAGWIIGTLILGTLVLATLTLLRPAKEEPAAATP